MEAHVISFRNKISVLYVAKKNFQKKIAMNQTLFEAMILGLSSFTLLGVISLKIDLAVLAQKHTNLEKEINELWEIVKCR